MSEVEIPETEKLEEERSKPFTRRVALVTACYAVFLAITSLGGSNAMKEMLLAQQQASDQWGYYQAKALREHLYQTQRTLMENEFFERSPSMRPETRQRFESLIKKFGEEETRFREEKKEIEKEARKLENERDLNRSKDPYFDFAEVLLQIAIILASISILAFSKPIFLASLAAAGLGCFLSFNGFFLVFRFPLF